MTTPNFPPNATLESVLDRAGAKGPQQRTLIDDAIASWAEDLILLAEISDAVDNATRDLIAKRLNRGVVLGLPISFDATDPLQIVAKITDW